LGRATLKLDSEKAAREKLFVVEERHCLGFREKKVWTVEKWIVEQGMADYNAMNDKWLEIVGTSKSLGPEETIQRKLQVFHMASYNLDKFRSFIFQSRFFDLFDVDPERRGKIASDDIALMLFSLDWLKFSLFGENTFSIKGPTSSTADLAGC